METIGKSPAFFDGYGAFRVGEPLSNCPTDPALIDDWRAGWITAKDAASDTKLAAIDPTIRA